jgi:hypothetical protein
MGAPDKSGRAVVNGAGQAVSALRASVPSAVVFAIGGLILGGVYASGYARGQSAGFDRARDAILCVGLASTGDTDGGNRRYCNKLGIDFAQRQARAIDESRRSTK